MPLFVFQAEDGIRDDLVTGVQTCALPILHVLLDLYGVLLDHEKMFRGYRERLAELLAARFGGTPETWRRAHDEAWVTYVRSEERRVGKVRIGAIAGDIATAIDCR